LAHYAGQDDSPKRSQRNHAENKYPEPHDDDVAGQVDIAVNVSKPDVKCRQSKSGVAGLIGNEGNDADNIKEHGRFKMIDDVS
jgi:hypothetical protein